MDQEQIINLNQLFRSDLPSFNQKISTMTSDELDRYIRSQKTAHIIQYLELKRPRLLVQAMWAKAVRQRIDQAKTNGSIDDTYKFPTDFDPQARMIE